MPVVHIFVKVPCLYVTWFMKYRGCGHITCYYMIYQSDFEFSFPDRLSEDSIVPYSNRDMVLK